MPDTLQLKLYNTLNRKKQVFEPIDRDNVRIYVCGPTVYDFAHIGNARPVIVFDVLYRLLSHIYGSDKVTYVRNITDVDDKINARALRDFPNLPLNEAIRKVTEKTTVQFQADAKALGCLEPNHEPRATEHIDGMVRMIGTLIEKGNAYAAGGEVLFEVSSMPDYGQLSNRNLQEQIAGARIATSSHKKNPGDFVLWKLSSENEPGWPSPWGRGRPGWHLECSVMSEHHLGKVFDIHGGGLDLIFPHHENEIAQSRCAHDRDKMANVWMHNGFLQLEGRKMSKSEGNFVTISELLHTENFGGKKWPGEVLRLAMLMTHYREPIDFSVKRLEEAKKILHRWADQKVRLSKIFEPRLAKQHVQLPGGSSLLDDLNLSPIFADLHKLGASGAKGSEADAVLFFVTLEILGFGGIDKFSQSAAESEMLADREQEAEIKDKISQRLAYIVNKNWASADAIRDRLLAQGIQLKDAKDPETGERFTTWEVIR